MSRRQAREVALQALFQLDYNEIDQTDAYDAVLSETPVLSDSAREYAKLLLDGTKAHLIEIDAWITKNSTEWKVDRMPGVDRNITRIAVFELQFSEEKMAPNIIINEAVELAKKFGTDASARFVNGILGSMIK
jgi:N utilization substance protein B